VEPRVLLDARLAAGGRRPHAPLEVVAGAGRIGDLDLGAGERRLDAAADLVGVRHRYASVGWYTLVLAHASAAFCARGDGEAASAPDPRPTRAASVAASPRWAAGARGPAGVAVAASPSPRGPV